MRRFVLCLISLVWLAISASAWNILSLDKTWDDQGISNDDSYAWYRIRVTIPSSIKNGATYIIPSHGVRFIKAKVEEEL